MEAFAQELGAHHYLDSNRENFTDELHRLGGAKVILATAPHAPSIAALVPGPGIDECLLIVAASFEPIQVGMIDFLSRNARVQGWSSGKATDSTDAMAFAAGHKVRPNIQCFPLERARGTYDAMMRGTVRFRSVIEIAN